MSCDDYKIKVTCKVWVYNFHGELVVNNLQ